jgi:hypothetical protein
MKRTTIGMCLVVGLCLMIGSTPQSHTAVASPAIAAPEPFIQVIGYCSAGGNPAKLNGACVGQNRFDPRTCAGARDLHQCPVGAIAKKPKFVRFGQFCDLEVDLARRCVAF